MKRKYIVYHAIKDQLYIAIEEGWFGYTLYDSEDYPALLLPYGIRHSNFINLGEL